MIVVRWIRAFVRFWVDFVVGDNWTVAAAVAAALVATWGLVRSGADAWWLTPLIAVLATILSLTRSATGTRRRITGPGSARPRGADRAATPPHTPAEPQ